MITLITTVQVKQSYVYVHKRASDNTIFYIGKGTKNRCTSIKGRNKYWLSIYSKHGVNCEIIANSLTDREAFLLEKKLIKEYGRLDLKTGTLVNMTDGGDGVINAVITEERKKQISQQSTGRHHSEDTKQYLSEINKGRIVSQEARRKISESRLGKHWTENIRKTILESRRHCLKSVICINTGEIYESASDAARKINGDSSLISKVCSGKRKHYRGLLWKFLNEV